MALARAPASARPLPRGEGPRSRGCITCKSRKVKCDQAKPACHRCISTNRQCAGYTPESELIFRNEIPRLERKHGRLNPSSSRAPSSAKDQGDPESDSTSSFNNPGAWTSLVPYPAPLEQQALTFFTSRYIILEPDTESEPMGYLQSLPMLLKDTDTDGCMYRAVYATALSALARDRRDTRLLVQARKQYATALSHTNLALTDRNQALLDETLMAVHLLGVFETTMSTTRNLAAWVKHLRGAEALIKLRGPSIFDTKAGTGLFHLSQGQMAIASLAARKNMFTFMPSIQKPGSKDVLSRASLNLNFEIPPLLEELDALALDADRSPSSLEQATKPLLERAAEIDVALEGWIAGLPRSWRPILSVSTRTTPPSSNSMPAPFFTGPDGVGRAEQYVNIWIACIINFGRASRITLLLTRMRTLEDLDHAFSPQTRHSSEAERLKGLIQSEVDSICMSVASNLGCQIDDASAFNQEKARHNAQALGGFFLLWPLWNCTEVSFLSLEQTSWLKAWMQFIIEARDLVSLSLEADG